MRRLAYTSVPLAHLPKTPSSYLYRHLSQNANRGAAQQERKSKRVIFSGIQPSGIPHIGNYIGALKNWIKLQNQNQAKPKEERDEIFYSIVGLHSITLPRDPKQLKLDKFEMMCTLLAIGLKPEQCCLFNQDEVPAHAQLAWILNCITPVGRLSRMTTWKSQIATAKNSNSLDEVDETMLHLGLLAYPVLQSADILLYKATQVPVGEDQEQHIELTRVIAKMFNKQFKSNVFPIPKVVFTPQSRILNLRNPTMKMSKSLPNSATRILITDSPDEIKSKIQSAVTDSTPMISYDPVNRPGVSNLLDIYHGLTDQPIEDRFNGKMAGELKSELTEVLIEHLRPIQVELEILKNHRDEVEKVFKKGSQYANQIAEQTLEQVKCVVGLS